jgi:hypothetical protein
VRVGNCGEGEGKGCVVCCPEAGVRVDRRRGGASFPPPTAPPDGESSVRAPAIFK